MRHTVPWSVKGVDHDAREAAKEAARRAGMSLGEWLNTAISDQAADAAPAEPDTGLATVTRRLESISKRLDAVTRRESGTAIPHMSLGRGDHGDIVRALDAVARLAEISERRSAAAIEAVERIGAPRASASLLPQAVAQPAVGAALPPGRSDHTAELDAIARSIRELDMAATPVAGGERAAAAPRRAFRQDIDQTVAEIAARQKALAGHRAEPMPQAAATVRISPGPYHLGSVPGDPGRDPAMEADHVSMTSPAVDIDALPWPNDPAQPPVTGMTRAQAAQACATRGRRLCS